MRLAALALLGRRDFSTGELREKLGSLGYGEEALAAAVAELTDERLLDDERYATQFVSAHARRGQGPQRIRQQLKEAGLASQQIESALADGPDWAELARQLRERRFGGQAPESWEERARQMRFLQYRGFSNDHIRSAFGNSADPDLDP